MKYKIFAFPIVLFCLLFGIIGFTGCNSDSETQVIQVIEDSAPKISTLSYQDSTSSTTQLESFTVYEYTYCYLTFYNNNLSETEGYKAIANTKIKYTTRLTNHNSQISFLDESPDTNTCYSLRSSESSISDYLTTFTDAMGTCGIYFRETLNDDFTYDNDHRISGIELSSEGMQKTEYNITTKQDDDNMTIINYYTKEPSVLSLIILKHTIAVPTVKIYQIVYAQE